MRKMTIEGPCACCGATTGIFWRTYMKPLDWGTGVVMEPKWQPVRCDACEQQAIHDAASQ